VVVAEAVTVGAGSNSTGSETGRNFVEVAGVEAAAAPAAVGKAAVDSWAGSIAAEAAGPGAAAAAAAVASEPGTDIDVGGAVEQVGRWHGGRTCSTARTGHGLSADH